MKYEFGDKFDTVPNPDLRKPLKYLGKKTIILELERVLVSLNEIYPIRASHPICKVFEIIRNRGGTYLTKLRPGLRTLLKTLAKEFELVVYTRLPTDLAGKIIEIVDPDR